MYQLDFDKVLLEALSYPEFIRPFFFVRKQEESGWLKGMYLTGLSEMYHHAIRVHDLIYGAKKREQPHVERNKFKIPIKRITGDETEGEIDRETLDSLHLSVMAAYNVGRQPKNFSSTQILSFVEYALGFIMTEFKIQIGEIDYRLSRPRTKTYFNYFIAQDAPFFDFAQFKHAIRDLFLNTPNQNSLKTILIRLEHAASKIVELWNEKVFKIHNIEHNEENDPELVYVEFKSDELQHSWWVNKELFELKGYKYFSNQAFAQYAASIANLISGDLNEGATLEAQSKNFVNDLILGIEDLYDKNRSLDFIKAFDQGSKKEAPFRDWFSTWFFAKEYIPDSESQMGNGYIDLKIRHKSIGKKVVEFKGWWNNDRKKVVQQICRYINDVNGDGYIFMINHLRSNISEEYKSLVMDESTGFIADSWKELSYQNYQYFLSEHDYGAEKKMIYHFIFNVNSQPNQMKKMKGGVLIIGSLYWDDHQGDHKDVRNNWRANRLQIDDRIALSVPIRYGRKSGKGILTMVFSKDLAENDFGTAYFVPFIKETETIENIFEEAGELSYAEGANDKDLIKGDNRWCAIGILFNPKLDTEKKNGLVTAYKQALDQKGLSEIFSSFRIAPESSMLLEDGQINMEWPKAIDTNNQNAFDQFDFLIATCPRQNLAAYPTAVALKESALGDDRKYFLNNVENGIKTHQDVEVLALIESSKQT